MESLWRQEFDDIQVASRMCNPPRSMLWAKDMKACTGGEKVAELKVFPELNWNIVVREDEARNKSASVSYTRTVSCMQERNVGHPRVFVGETSARGIRMRVVWGR